MHSFAHMHLQTIPRNGIGESKDTRTDDFVRSCQLPLQRAESIFFAPSTIGESPQIFWEEVFLEYQPVAYPRLPCLYSWHIGMTQKASVYTPQVFHKSHGQNQIPKFLGICLHILSFTFFFGKKKTKKKQMIFAHLKWAWETWKEVQGKFIAFPHSTSTNLVCSKSPRKIEHPSYK